MKQYLNETNSERFFHLNAVLAFFCGCLQFKFAEYRRSVSHSRNMVLKRVCECHPRRVASWGDIVAKAKAIRFRRYGLNPISGDENGP